MAKGFAAYARAAALIAAGSRTGARAAFKPTKPVEIVVHNGPGSGPDIFGRTVAQTIEQEKLAPVRFQVVEQGRRRRRHGGQLHGRAQGRRPCARRLHQRLDDQPAGAEGSGHQGRRHDADLAAGGRAGGDRGARGLAVQDAARRDGCGAQGARQDQAGRRLAARARRAGAPAADGEERRRSGRSSRSRRRASGLLRCSAVMSTSCCSSRRRRAS